MKFVSTPGVEGGEAYLLRWGLNGAEAQVSDGVAFGWMVIFGWEMRLRMAVLAGLCLLGYTDLRGDHGACVLHRGDRFVVAPADGIAANFRHLFEHLHAVF